MTDEVTTLPEGATSADATLAAALGSDFHPEPRDEQPPQAAAEPQTGAEQPEGSDGEQPA